MWGFAVYLLGLVCLWLINWRVTFIPLRPQYEALVPVLESTKVKLEQKVSMLNFDLKTLQAELMVLREKENEPCANCAAMMEETRVEKIRRGLKECWFKFGFKCDCFAKICNFGCGYRNMCAV